MAQRRPRTDTSRLDFALGVLVAFGVGFLLITLAAEFSGQDAVFPAVILGAFAVTIGILYRRRRRISAGSGGGGDRSNGPAR